MTTQRKVGLVILTGILLFAVFGRFIAPYSPTEVVGTPYSSQIGLLGLDALGRDVWSRVLYGGLGLIVTGVVATAVSYLLAAPVGVFMALRGGGAERVMTWLNDVVLAFPPILLLLLLATSAGKGVTVVVVAVIIGHFPQVCRLARASASDVVLSSYVDASWLRGERTFAIARRDVWPNVMPTLAADFGTRTASSILLIAGATFLGLGETPPSSNWALMVSENRIGLSIQPLATLAPAVLIGLFIFGVNLAGDRAARTRRRNTLKRSGVRADRTKS
ncbi:ABC transporter permease [Mycolicibacterium confluentis]|uniref:Peptide ABC transporter permease n=1 Tax=Mycolicibacterium confluentis TaxID=28047 RepID=A0A7I7XWR8_9MYCO|nr:ABC transporter permease [Mycolicibacterium confluentis]MCV7321870.1 ABC transporter permease [Mycolicibacterium confluentis]ORV32125.1 hypothetical protein AWB99_10735 [Mycolicibacterium confluentis]BBZ33687.1 peptide ABC transporter permease [Mycolicibacterium confluentis]